jgi:hypothetical protein
MASVRHLNLFPWCVNQSTSYFKDEDIAAKAVPMWWRVKKWDFAVSGDYLIFGVTPDTFSDTGVFDVTELTILNGQEETYATETDLVRAGVVYSAQPFPVFNPETQQFDFVNTLRLARDHVFGTDAGPMVDSFVKIGPHFECFFFADDSFSVSTSSGEGVGQVGSFSVSMNGLSFSVPLYANEDVTAFNASITASEYWSYDPGDGGGPIYDSTTGARLRPFPD